MHTINIVFSNCRSIYVSMVVYLFHYSTIKCIQRNAIICNFCNILQHLFHSNIVEALANTTLLAIIVNFIGNIVILLAI